MLGWKNLAICTLVLPESAINVGPSPSSQSATWLIRSREDEWNTYGKEEEEEQEEEEEEDVKDEENWGWWMGEEGEERLKTVTFPDSSPTARR